MPAHRYIKPAIVTLGCLGLKSAEKLLIITDQNKLSIAWALFDAALEMGAEVQLIRIPVAETHGSEPPEPLPEYMTKFDAIIAPTTKSISHTKARRTASKAGVRIATMPDILEETFLRTMEADYKAIAARGEQLAALLEKVEHVRITSPLGTEISFEKAGRKILNDSGLLHGKGDFGNLPAGEVFLAPMEGSGDGVLAIDGSMAGFGLLDMPLMITIEKGYAVEISGNKGDQLAKLIEPHGKDGRNLAEFGIGTNDKARLCGSPLEDEKVLGTVHFALGDNQSMGGSVAVSSHLDGIILKPTVWFDDKIIMSDGRFIK